MDECVSGLNVFRNIFYSRSFDLFVRYLSGLLLSENKTIDGLNAVFVEKTDQSNVNRLLTEYPWHKTDFVDEIGVLFKQHLGLGKSQLRKRRGVVRHLHLVAVAYCLLKFATWLKRGWKNFSVGERVRNIKEFFEKNTIIKTINENKKNITA